MVKNIDAKMARNKVNLEQTKIENRKIVVDQNDSKSLSDRVVKIEFSGKFLFILGSVVLLFIFWSKISSVLLILFFAYVLASGFMPIITWLQTKKISKQMSIAITFVSFIVLASIVISLVVVPFLNEIDSLVTSFPNLTEKAINLADASNTWNIPFISVDSTQIRNVIEETLRGFTSNVTPILTNGFDGLKTAINTIAGVAGGIVTVFTAFMLSIYMLNDHDYVINSFLTKFVDYRRHELVRKLLIDVETKLGNWIVGQLVLSFVIGILVWIILTILGVPFALPLAVLAAILESIPTLGPLLSAIPAILLAFVDGGVSLAIYVTIGYVIIQQLEGALIVPKVMGNAVGMRAIYVLIGILIGFSLGEFVGALLAVPVMVVIKIGLEFYFDLQRLRAIDKI
jgi:predicted PurR-regulated permease PerM